MLRWGGDTEAARVLFGEHVSSFTVKLESRLVAATPCKFPLLTRRHNCATKIACGGSDCYDRGEESGQSMMGWSDVLGATQAPPGGWYAKHVGSDWRLLTIVCIGPQTAMGTPGPTISDFNLEPRGLNRPQTTNNSVQCSEGMEQKLETSTYLNY